MSYQPPQLPPPPPGGEPPPAEVLPEEPQQGSKAPMLVGLALLLGLVILVGAVVAWLAAPGRCDSATFTSDRFGYCMTAPTGWTAETARVGDTPVDRFLQPDGAAVVYVQAVALDPGQDLNAFADYVRTSAQQAGYTVGTPAQLQIDGVAAVSWDKSTNASADDAIVREVVFVRGDTGWRVQFADSASSFDAHTVDFQQMLATWHFA
jgi:hypothetical protein